jgi:hypothetical protein
VDHGILYQHLGYEQLRSYQWKDDNRRPMDRTRRVRAVNVQRNTLFLYYHNLVQLQVRRYPENRKGEIYAERPWHRPGHLGELDRSFDFREHNLPGCSAEFYSAFLVCYTELHSGPCVFLAAHAIIYKYFADGKVCGQIYYP